MRGSFADAKVGSGITPEDSFYANRVDVEKRLVADHWSVWHLKVNANVSTLGFKPLTPEQSALIDLQNVIAVIDSATKTLAVKNGDRELMVLDIAQVYANMGAQQVLRVHFGLRFNEIIILAVDEDYTGPLPYFLGSTDLNPSGLSTCSEIHVNSLTQEKSQCQRPVGHKGRHQFYTKRGYGNFDRGGSAFCSQSSFGFPGYCQHCGYMVTTNGQIEVTCFSCGHWLRMLKECGNEQRFVVKGRHYMPRTGGFYGHKFKVRREDGSLWTGELFTQGEVPAHLRHLFPDNAVFED